MADAGRSWLSALLARQRRRLANTQRQMAWSGDSRWGLDERILATRTQIVALHRSLAMQKLVLDAARRVRPIFASRPASQERPSAPASRLDLPLDDEGLTGYADTEPMSFMDSRPFNAAETTPK